VPEGDLPSELRQQAERLNSAQVRKKEAQESENQREGKGYSECYSQW